ncbi:ABC transporter permease [Thermoflexus sp.]|uniref:ABC transporter permease n=1 Tax=Thermoflexus sp. TaxID=1969742 RepID=UPI002ADD3E38|nr:ABC transporter permease [Thermoflexus sp.]
MHGKATGWSARVRNTAWLPRAGAALLFVLMWSLVVRLGDYPPFILPGPEQVAARMWALAASGSLWRHWWATAVEVGLGLSLGVTVGLSLAYPLAHWRLFERMVAPYLVASQAVPIVAVAPLLIIWFGPGLLARVLVSALIAFFPVLIAAIAGFRQVPPEWRELFRSLRATRWQTFWKLEWPAALPVIFGGLKIGATLSVIGAFVGELISADRGIGFLIKQGQGLYDTPLVFGGILLLASQALLLYGMIAALEHRWAQRE